jgi:hypothetical protein
MCSMKDRPSKDPREVLMRAAMHHAAALAGMLANEFASSYAGPDRAGYLAAPGARSRTSAALARVRILSGAPSQPLSGSASASPCA